MVEEPAEDAAVLKESSIDEDNDLEVRVLTLNIWGIPGVSHDREARINAICQQISGSSEPYSFVLLQEVWNPQDYKTIAAKLKDILPHSHFFYSGVIGAGLCIFSKSPLTSVHFHPWSVNGLPHKIYHGDWWGGKGVGLCRTQLNGVNFLIATTHLHAVYHHLQDEYLHHRVVQAYETSQVLDWCACPDTVIILAGDLNCEPHEVPYRLIRYNANFKDAFVEAPNKPVDGIGATNETPGNSYTSVAALRLDPTGKRIDHILYRAPRNVAVKVKLCDLPWPLRVPGSAFSFSDHEAVRAVFSIRKTDGTMGDDVAVSNNGSSPHRFLAQGSETRPLAVNGGVGDKLKSNTANNNSNNSLQHKSLQSAVSKLTVALHQQTDTLLDAAAICAQGRRAIDSSWNFYVFLTVALTLVNLILIGVICEEDSLSTGLTFFLMMLLLVTVVVTFYCIWMLIIWNKMERNAVLATQLGLECLLEDMRKKNAAQYQKTSVPDLRRSSNDK
ncbi:Endonuclease/exonuclease/phosphatase [Trinorchestia longiramus]|nr:Endonuclease/exonuclease/phosphatase [Trinorchestia longiramus]